MDNHFDKNLPPSLKKLQEWFGGVVHIPLAPDCKLPPFSSSGENIIEEAAQYINPTPTLRPHERIEIYHQQYWWRLISMLQDNFPTLTRLLNYNFNSKIAIPYIHANPPTECALCKIGATLPSWLETHYKEDDHYIINLAAEIDWAANESYWIGALPPFTGTPQQLLSSPVTLQPYVHLFAMKADFFSFRATLLSQDPSFYETHPFPPLNPTPTYGLLFRSPDNTIHLHPLPPQSFTLLTSILKGKPPQNPPNDLLKEWIANGLFVKI